MRQQLVNAAGPVRGLVQLRTVFCRDGFAAIAVIDTAKSTDHLMTLLGRSSLRAGSLRRARSYLGEEGRRITRFTLPVCEDPNQIAFHAVASDVVPAHVMCALVHGDAGH